MSNYALALHILFGAIFYMNPTCLSARQISPRQTESRVSNVSTHEDLDAVWWIQTSAEFEAITRQTFRLAELNLGDALMDPTWTASTEQQKMFAKKSQELAKLPPAVILDIDETVLDNSGYQTWLIENGKEFDPSSWNDFVRQEASPAISGSKEFIQACRDAQIAVLYVSNREVSVEYATRRNLVSTGLLHEDDPDVVFSKKEREGWGSDKQPRRTYLASRYRILMMLGDDLNDFVSLGRHPTSEKRKNIAVKYGDWWGRRWVALPNPNYGGWERSLYDWNDRAPRSKKLEGKKSKLRK